MLRPAWTELTSGGQAIRISISPSVPKILASALLTWTQARKDELTSLRTPYKRHVTVFIDITKARSHQQLQKLRITWTRAGVVDMSWSLPQS